jgi:hypothetical protein
MRFQWFVWLGLASFGLAWFGLAWLGSVWLGLVRFGLAWFGLAWLGVCAIARHAPGIDDAEPNSSVFLLSPARLDGQRGALLAKPTADFELARALRSPEGAPLADVFSFISGLYFRGKVAYAREFGGARTAAPGAYVLTAGGGLCDLDERVTLPRLERWANVVVSEKNPHFTAPLIRTASEALASHAATRFVLLGSVATNKYVAPLLDVFGDRIFFPKAFAGLGDKSRGALLLGAVREHRELAYASLRDRGVSLAELR